MNGSIFLASLGLMYNDTSKSLTVAAKRTLNSEASKCVMGAIPLLPARIFCQVSSTVFPTGDTIPSPVTTTRLLNSSSSKDLHGTTSCPEHGAKNAKGRHRSDYGRRPMAPRQATDQSKCWLT